MALSETSRKATRSTLEFLWNRVNCEICLLNNDNINNNKKSLCNDELFGAFDRRPAFNGLYIKNFTLCLIININTSSPLHHLL